MASSARNNFFFLRITEILIGFFYCIYVHFNCISIPCLGDLDRSFKRKKKQKNTCSFSSPQPKANPGLWAVHLFLVLTGLAPRDQNYRYQEKGNGIRGSLTRPRLIKTERSSLLMKRRSAPQAHNLVNKENSQKVHCVGVHIFFFFFYLLCVCTCASSLRLGFPIVYLSCVSLCKRFIHKN